MFGVDLQEDKSAILCNVNKFTDGSPLFNKPFVIVRDGYLFTRQMLSQGKAKEMEQRLSDIERVFAFIKKEREKNKYPTKSVVIGEFKNNGNPISKVAVETALNMIQYHGHMGEKIKQIDNPDITVKDKALVITDEAGVEQ